MIPRGSEMTEAQQKKANSAQGREFVEQACGMLYFCYMKCVQDGTPWPDDLDQAHRILWAHLGRDEESRLAIVNKKVLSLNTCLEGKFEVEDGLRR